MAKTFLSEYPTQFGMTLLVGFVLAHVVAVVGPRWQDWLARKLQARAAAKSTQKRHPSRQWRRQMQVEHVAQLAADVDRSGAAIPPRAQRRLARRTLVSMFRNAAKRASSQPEPTPFVTVEEEPRLYDLRGDD